MKTNAIGDAIRAARRERDVTQRYVSDMMGVTERTVARWECGETAPDAEELEQLGMILGVQFVFGPKQNGGAE